MSEFRILSVDDEPDICNLLDEVLTGEGYQVRTAHDSRSAMQVFHDFNPHLVLLDVMLPDENGIEILKKMMAEDNNVKVVMVSAFMDLKIAKEAIKYGAIEYVGKPIQLDNLIEYISGLEKDTLGEEA
ncbi:response regulator [bacterium]|nr:response regulator [bacterium]